MLPAMLIRAGIVLGLLGMIATLPSLATAEAAPRAKVTSKWAVTKRPSMPSGKWLPPNPCRKAACRR